MSGFGLVLLLGGLIGVYAILFGILRPFSILRFLRKVVTSIFVFAIAILIVVALITTL